MKSFFAAASLAATASAAAFRRGGASSCGFQIVSTGGVNGVMGQFEDGQNRINGSYPPATYHYNNGGIVDDAGRGCIVTYTNDATQQFQCDLNKPPTYGFTIAQNGSILYQGSDQFYACPYITEYNIYTKWLQGQDKCVPVKLSTNATCAAGSYPTGTAASYNSTGAAGTGVPVVPGYSSQAPYPSPAGQTIPTYGQSTGAVPAVPYGSQSTPAGTAPSYSQATVPSYGGASSASIPQYSSVETAATGYGTPSSAYVPVASSVETSPVASADQVPGYGGETSQVSVPGYGSQTAPVESTPVETSPVESAASVPSYGGESSQVSVPGYGSQTAPAESTPVETSPVESTLPAVPQYSTGVESQTGSIETVSAVSTTLAASTPEVSSPVESTEVETTPASIASYPSSAQFTVIQLTTVLTKTETAVRSGTTIYTTYETQSVFSSVATASVPAPSESAPAETPSSPIESVSSASATGSVPGYGPGSSTSVVESQTPIPSYPASSYSESVPTPTESVPQQTTSVTSEEIVSTPVPLTSVASTPAVSTPVESMPVVSTPVVSESSTFTEETSVSTPVVSTPAVSTPATSESTTCTEKTSASTPTTFATTWSVPAGNNSVPAPTETASSYTQTYSQPYGSGSSNVPSGTVPATSTSASASTCQTSLSGAYQTPHLITWIAKDYPDTAYGSKYNATINEDCSTIMNFDIPQEYEGKTCSVIFLFPEQKDLETSAWSWNNQGGIEFDTLSSAATESTTYNTCPAKKDTLNTIDIQAGNSYVVKTGACAAGTTESIELSSSNGLQLEFFEDWNPSSLGLYITAC